MNPALRSGEIIANRYRVVNIMGKGGLATIYKLVDENDQPFSLKVFDSDLSDSLPEYIEHLGLIHKSLLGLSSQIVVPKETGYLNGSFYTITDYIESAENLEEVVEREGRLHPRMALTITAKTAELLSNLHVRSVVHADIKPSNILVSFLPDLEVYLIDFGMAQSITMSNGVLLMSTYQYLPPEIRGEKTTEDRPVSLRSEPIRKKGSIQIGPFIDIYALALVAMRMLTGSTALPSPLSPVRIEKILSQRNSWLRTIPSDIASMVSALLFDMVTVRPGKKDLAAKDVAARARALAASMPDETSREPRTENEAPSFLRRSGEETPSMSHESARDNKEAAIRSLKDIADSLQYTTAILFAKEDHIETVQASQADSQMLSDVDSVFSNAKSRTRNAWHIAVGMTIASFVVILAMIVLAVLMTVTTGKGWWVLIFGGTSVTLSIGTLIWRPFDRIFRATILAQQIEMIHLHTVASFRTTASIEKRIQIFQEAIASLEVLFINHSKVDARENSSLGRAKKKGNKQESHGSF